MASLLAVTLQSKRSIQNIEFRIQRKGHGDHCNADLKNIFPPPYRSANGFLLLSFWMMVLGLYCISLT